MAHPHQIVQIVKTISNSPLLGYAVAFVQAVCHLKYNQYNTISLLKFQEQKSKAYYNKNKRIYILYVLGKAPFDWQVVMPLYGLFGHKTKPHDLKNIPNLILDRRNLLNSSYN